MWSNSFQLLAIATLCHYSSFVILCHEGHISLNTFSKGVAKSWLRTNEWYLASSLARVLGSIDTFWSSRCFCHSCSYGGTSHQLFGACGTKCCFRLRSVAHNQNSTILKNIVEIIVVRLWTCAWKVIIIVADLWLVVIDSYVLMASILGCVNRIFFKFTDCTKSLFPQGLCSWPRSATSCALVWSNLWIHLKLLAAFWSSKIVFRILWNIRKHIYRFFTVDDRRFDWFFSCPLSC